MSKCDYVLKDKKTIFIDKRASLGKNVIVYENCRIEGDCDIGDNVTIFPNSFISKSIIGKGTKIYSSIIENCKFGVCASVGPYCHMRSADIEDFVHIGDFSVIKQTKILKNTILQPYTYMLNNEHITYDRL